ncbi:hypothetical protein BGZ46_000705 [Entomortierella lignicola]|nr:hypothetical protein BGZ46_000705 [Entomortierella lignicola]
MRPKITTSRGQPNRAARSATQQQQEQQQQQTIVAQNSVDISKTPVATTTSSIPKIYATPEDDQHNPPPSPPSHPSLDYLHSHSNQEIHSYGSRTPTSIYSSSFTSPTGPDQPPKTTVWQNRFHKGTGAVVRFIQKKVPMLTWLVCNPGYRWKEDLTQDIFAGATISTVIIPQSMAYAMLASLPPVHGLYTSLVPTILYAILGTSRHMSTGTFAITSLLLGQFAHKVLIDQGNTDTIPENEYQRRYLTVCLTLTFFIGAIQILLSMARLGQWVSKHLLPITLVSGFNIASAFHIGTHQLKHCLGMNPPREGGVFSMIKTWIWFIQHFWEDVVWPSLGLGIAAMLLMYILQRIEYRRRSASDLVVNSSSHSALSPSPSPASASIPNYRSSPSNTDLPFTTSRHSHSRLPRVTSRTGKHLNRRVGRRRRSIFPKAASDQALLTAQDIALDDGELSYDSSSSSNWTPVITPSVDNDNMIPDLDLPASSSSHTPESTRYTVGMDAGSTVKPNLPDHIVTGLTNTGAFSAHHHNERTRSQLLSPSLSPLSPPKAFRYKTFRSSASTGNHMEGSEDEQEPLLTRARHAANQTPTRLGFESPVVSSYGSDQYYSSSNISSELLTGQGSQQGSPQGGNLEQRVSALSRFIPNVHFPIPDIFICVVVFTAATVIFDLDELYNIEVIGHIPTGLPSTTWPPTMIEGWSTREWTSLLWPSFLMAIMVYVMSLAVAKHFGREYGYEVDADQEMLALGTGSLVGSCFGAYACTGSLTRSAILAQSGAKTPLASLVGALMVLMTLLWFTFLFERIPDTILAAIVIISLRSLLVHTIEAKRLWRVGRRKDALIWWVTFISVMVFSIEIGLAVGMATVVIFKLYKYGLRWEKTFVRSVKQSATFQRLMLKLGLQSPLFTTSGRGLYTADDGDDY